MTNKITSIVDLIDERVAVTLTKVAAFVLVIWVCVMTVGIIGRSFFNLSWHFMEEYTRYMNMVVICGGLAYATYKSEHISVKLLVNRFPKRTRLILECLTTAPIIWLMVFFVLKMFNWFLSAIRNDIVSTQSPTPMWVPYLVVIIGLCSFILALSVYLSMVYVIY